MNIELTRATLVLISGGQLCTLNLVLYPIEGEQF